MMTQQGQWTDINEVSLMGRYKSRKENYIVKLHSNCREIRNARIKIMFLTIVALILSFGYFLWKKNETFALKLSQLQPFYVSFLMNREKRMTKYELFQHLSQKYGDNILSYYDGVEKITVVNGGDAVNEVYKKGEAFSSRSPNFSLQIVNNSYRDALHVIHLKHWKVLRKISFEALIKNTVSTEKFDTILYDESQQLIQRLSRYNKQPVSPTRDLMLTVVNITSRLVFDQRFNFNDGYYKYVERVLNQSFNKTPEKRSGKDNNLWLNALRKIQDIFVTSSKGSRDDRFLEEMILKVRESSTKSPSNTASHIVNEVEKMSTKLNITDQTIKNYFIFTIVFEIFFSSLEPVIGTLSWFILLASQHKLDSKKISSELNHVSKNIRSKRNPDVHKVLNSSANIETESDHEQRFHPENLDETVVRNQHLKQIADRLHTNTQSKTEESTFISTNITTCTDFNENLTENINNIMKLDYLKSILHEVQRLASIVPLYPRQATHNATIGNHYIAKDSKILLNIFSLHYDKTVWKTPNQFKPERWLDDQGHFKMRNSKYFAPFGGGMRRCLGEIMAKREMTLIMFLVLKHFDILPNGSHIQYDLTPKEGTFNIPAQFEVIFKSK